MTEYSNEGNSAPNWNKPFHDEFWLVFVAGGPTEVTVEAQFTEYASSNPGGGRRFRLRVGNKIGHRNAWSSFSNAPGTEINTLDLTAGFNVIRFDGYASADTSGLAEFVLTLDGAGGVCAPIPEVATASCNIAARLIGSCDNKEGNPVSTRSGALVESFTDVDVSGPGAGLRVRRSYNSLQRHRDGPFGPGWQSNLSTRLYVDEPGVGEVTFVTPTGAEVSWTETNTAGVYSAPMWVTAGLSRDDSGPESVYEVDLGGGSVWRFDETGMPTSAVDRNGYETSYHYDSGGDLERIVEEATQRELTFDWVGDRIVEVTDSAARSVTYEYNDSDDNLTDVFDVDGGHWHFAYDGDHRLTHKRDPYQSAQAPPGSSTVNEYDTEDRVWRQTDPQGQVTTFDYSTPGSTTITLPGNNLGPRVKVDEYDITGRRVRTTTGAGTPDAVTHRFAYDQRTGGITAVVLESVTPERLVASTSYDLVGNVTSVADALDRTTTFGDYNEFGSAGLVVHPDGAQTVTVFDAAGNVESSTTTGVDATATSVAFDYHPTWPGLVESMTDPRGKVWSYGYDANGYQDRVTDPLGHEFTASYDVVGRLESQVAPKGNLVGANPLDYTTTFETNAFGQVTKVTDPLGHATSSVLDELGRVSQTVDADLRVTQYRYDDVGRVFEVERNDQSVIATEYWPDGLIKAQVDAASERTEFFYDAVGRLTVQVDPLSRAREFGYHGDGSLWWRQDPGGDCGASPPVGCAHFTADAAGQTTTITYSDDQTPDVVDVVYDDAGRPTSVVTTADTMGFAYDGLGRLTSSTEGGVTVGYTWNPAGQVETITYPGSATITRGYDDAGRWVSLTDWDSRVFTFDPDEHGNLEAINFPGAAGSVDRYDYDRADRLEGVTFETNSAGWATIDYGRTDAGLLSSMTQTGLPGPSGEAYGYDDLGRLQTAGATTYRYDDAGNLTTRDALLEQRFDEANQLCTQMWPAGPSAPGCEAPPANAIDVVHNARGEREHQAPPDTAGPPSEFTYDAEGRMLSAAVPTAPGNFGEFTAVTPEPLVDTRPGSGLCPTGGCVALAPDDTLVVKVAGEAGVPAAGAADAVSLSITTEGVSSGGWLVAYSTDVAEVPDAVSAHFMDAEIHTVGVLTKVGSTGEVAITNRGFGTAHVAVGVNGWFSGTWGPSGGTLTTIDPLRVFDSEPSGIASDTAVDVTVAGVGGVPAEVGAVIATVSVTDAAADGPVVAYSTDETSVPSGVSVWAETGSQRSSLVTVPVGADGKVRVHNGTTDDVDVTVDVVAYTSPPDPSDPDGGIFAAMTPETVFYDEAVSASVTETFPVPTTANVDAEVAAVALSITVALPTADGTATMWAGDATQPTDVVSLSFPQNTTATATVIVAYDHTGNINLELTEDAWVQVDLVGVWFGARTTYQYTYNADGLRQTKTAPDGTTTNYHWDKSTGIPLLVAETTGSWWVRYLYGPQGAPIAQISPLGATWLHHDQLGSVRAITHPDTGAAIATYTYDPWGTTTHTTGTPWATRFGYAGEHTDPETGFVYLRARYYDPTTGTFLTRDPLETTTRDPYGYANTSPHNYTDPTGLCSVGPVRIGFMSNSDNGCRGSGVASNVGGVVADVATDPWFQAAAVGVSCVTVVGCGPAAAVVTGINIGTSYNPDEGFTKDFFIDAGVQATLGRVRIFPDRRFPFWWQPPNPLYKPIYVRSAADLPLGWRIRHDLPRQVGFQGLTSATSEFIDSLRDGDC